MSTTLHRVLLTVLAFTAAFTGGWAYVAPRSWYESFPGFGLSWLPQLGPYNEHFCKDTGAMFLALLVLSVAAIAYVNNGTLVKITASAWLTFNVLHFVYHMSMLHMYNTRDAVLNVVCYVGGGALAEAVRHAARLAVAGRIEHHQVVVRPQVAGEA